MEHFNSFLPSWSLTMCIVKLDFCEHLWSQMENLNGFLPSWMVAICISKLHFSKKKVLGTFGFFDDFWQLLVNLRGLKHAPDLNKMLMDYSNNTKVIQWHKNLWKSDKTNNKFMEKLGKRTKHTFENWQINWLSNHV